jgi:hypothetical protein
MDPQLTPSHKRGWHEEPIVYRIEVLLWCLACGAAVAFPISKYGAAGRPAGAIGVAIPLMVAAVHVLVFGTRRAPSRRFIRIYSSIWILAYVIGTIAVRELPKSPESKVTGASAGVIGLRDG